MSTASGHILLVILPEILPVFPPDVLPF